MNAICSLVAFFVWVAGVILAKGFWSTLFAIFIPFWAWYLVIERALTAWGWTA